MDPSEAPPDPAPAPPSPSPADALVPVGLDPSVVVATTRVTWRAWAAAGALALLAGSSWVLETRVWLRASSAWEYDAAGDLVRKGMLEGDAFTTAPAYALRAPGTRRGAGL